MENTGTVSSKKRFGCLHVLLVIIIILLIGILGSMWWLKRNVYAKEFKPVTLNSTEQVQLESKLDQIEASDQFAADKPDRLTAETYTESTGNRTISFSERELNSLLANDPAIAKNVAFDLTDDMISVKIIAPMEQGIPVLGGKTFKLSMGVTVSYKDGKPVVIMRGISLGGIPLPSAWWGDIKGRNLVEEFGTEGGFWDLFSKGVEHLEVKDGKFILKLKE